MFRKKNKPQENRQPVNRAPVFRYYQGSESVEGSVKNLNAKTHTQRTGSRRHEATQRRFKLRFTMRKLPTYLAILLVIGAFVGNSMISSVPVLRTTSQKVELRNTQEYQEGIREILAQSLWNRNKLSFSSSRIEKTIQQKYPEISSVVVSLPLVGRQPVIGIQFDEPAFKVMAKNGNFVLSRSGRVLLDSNLNVNIPTINDVSGLQYKTGLKVLTPEDVAFLQSLFAEMNAKGQTIEYVRIGMNPRDLILKLKDDTYYIKMNFLHDIRAQLGSLWAAKKQLAERGESPSEYIDVRLSERVFVK